MVCTLNAAHFIQAPSSELSETMASPASFKLFYFPILGLGGTSRDIMSYGGAEFECVSPGTWSEEKGNTPMGCLPVLFITGKNGKQVTISEAAVIEQYLAKLYGLLGDNEYEETLIKSFQNTSNSLQNVFASLITWNQPEASPKCLAYFKANSLPSLCESLERHLKDNGNNGHFVGNKLSLADIRVSNMLEHFAQQPCASELIEILQKYPNLYKMRESVANHPKLAAWRKSEGWTTIDKTSKAFFENPFAFLS
ncbi:Glutathione S-transferase S1 [Podila horticola]|nr:Glutathione S-transferase S1 [Podila horticola]